MFNAWKYKGQFINNIEDLPDHETIYGFVYIIQDTVTLKPYIGKKVLRNTRKKKISQKVKKATKTRKTYERTVKESDWLDYYGSSKELLADVQKYGKQRFERIILELCCTKKYLSYAEVSWQMKLDVLRQDTYNGNILGRYYPRDMKNCYP
jgi:hypothetical protein